MMPAISAGQVRAMRAMLEVTSGRRHRRRQVPRARTPKGEQLQYARELVQLTSQCAAVARRIVREDLTRILRSAGRLTEDGIRNDALSDDLEDTIAKLTFEMGQIVTFDRARTIATERATKVNRFNREEVNRQARAVVGVDVFGTDPKVAEYLPTFIRENTKLIRSIPEEMIKDVDRVITRGAVQGLRVEEIASQLEQRFNVSESKAMFIARDQIGSINGKLTEIRQTSVGAKRYRWRTSKDERVRGNPTGKYPNARPSHWAREGQIYEWANPPEGGAPGFAPQCRCTPEFLADELLTGLGL